MMSPRCFVPWICPPLIRRTPMRQLHLELVGATAIEDKLQDGVPEAIETLLDANIKVWMITGDKQETAINIAISCNLIRHPDSLLICNGDSYEGIKDRLYNIQSAILSGGSRRSADKDTVRHELVIDGTTLTHVLGTDLEPLLSDIGALCSGVVICRASPSQKAAIVKMMMEYEMRQASSHWFFIIRPLLRYKKRLESKMLAIGDGANDVSMLQVADIGVGIAGKEGRQAVNNSDYSISQFRFLVRLLLLHGTTSYLRITKLIAFSFYKNSLITWLQFFFQFFCGFSGVSILDTSSATLYNIVFTALPIIGTSLLDRPTRYLNTLLRYPMLYRNPQNRFTTRQFWLYGVFNAAIDSIPTLFLPFIAFYKPGSYAVADMYSLYKAAFVTLMVAVTVEIYFLNRFQNVVFHVLNIGSLLFSFAFLMLYGPLMDWMGSPPDPSWTGVSLHVLSSPHFWFMFVTLVAVLLGKRYFLKAFFWLHFPSDNMLACEIEHADQEGEPIASVDAHTVQRVSRLLSTTSRKGYQKLEDDSGVMRDANLDDAVEDVPFKSAYMTFDEEDDDDRGYSYDKVPVM